MKPALTIRYVNHSSWSEFFPSYLAALEYARDKISYSGGRIAKVYATDEYGSDRTLWQHDWDEPSKRAGLTIPR